MTRQPRMLTLIALACALFLRAYVPTGWMPATNGTAFAIEPCAAAAPAPMAMHGEASHHDSSHKAQHDGECSFAPLSAGLAANHHAPAFIAPSLAAAARPDHGVAPFFATGPPALPPPATGPPAIA